MAEFRGSRRKLVRVTADVQAIFCRRRHQARRPPLIKISPGRPAPAMGPGTTAQVPGAPIATKVHVRHGACMTESLGMKLNPMDRIQLGRLMTAAGHELKLSCEKS
jgi:hypothetical protein